MDMTTTTATNLDRAFCKPCNKMFALPEGMHIDWMQVVPRIANEARELQKHECGNYLRGATVQGRYSDKIVCNEKCQSATRPVCECSCSGENHGA